jgi:hypothetical protein
MVVRQITVPTWLGAAVGAVLCLALLGAATSAAASSRGCRASTAAALPTLSWPSVRGADHYAFELAADASFDAPVLGSAGRFLTRNTSATIVHSPPDGTYYWRVRAVAKSGGVLRAYGGCVAKKWAGAPAPIGPADGSTVAGYPDAPLVLSWRPVIGAASYEVELATEPTFAKLVGGRALQTAATSFVPAGVLPGGATYWWRVTPIDADHNEGPPSPARSFQLPLVQASGLAVADLNTAPEFYDPQFSWQRVPGAARYELEINYSQDFAVGSRVCCSKPTGATSYAPTKLLDNNTYSWRVRPIDRAGNAGGWTTGPQFEKTFDTVPPVAGQSIHGIQVVDNNGNVLGASQSTQSPIVRWQPVAGASAYQVNAVLYTNGSCEWSAPGFSATTPITAWTPLDNRAARAPYPSGSLAIQRDSTILVPGQYCVRVRALGDNGSSGRVYGDFTYVTPAFTFGGYPTSGGGPTPTVAAGDYHAASDAATGSSQAPLRSTPLLTWRAIPGATSYWVLVARDASFTNLVDYAITRIPAYAPRKAYADETTSYYWAVLPSSATTADGANAIPDPHLVPLATFDKSSTPPQLQPLDPGVGEGSLPSFRWSPVLGARSYRLQVSTDPTFSAGILQDVTTDSTAFTSDTTYPPGKPLYVRVRANDESSNGLTWSDTQRFVSKLPPPALLPGPRSGALPPVLRWRPLPYAVAYDLRLEEANGSRTFVNGIPAPSFVPPDLRGLGVVRWSVRGEFPRGSATIPGEWSPPRAFTHTLAPPRGGRVIAGRDLLFRWVPVAGVRGYTIEISATPDFGRVFDRAMVEGNAYAPTLQQSQYAKGGTLYWHVAATDSDGDTGSFGRAHVFRLAAGG